MSETDTLKAMVDMTRDLVIWGSPDVVHSFSNYRDIILKAGTQPADASQLIAIESIFRAIRKDLGHNDSKVPTGSILRLFINDVDRYLPKR